MEIKVSRTNILIRIVVASLGRHKVIRRTAAGSACRRVLGISPFEIADLRRFADLQMFVGANFCVTSCWRARAQHIATAG
jgi:hypothetical protein